MLLSITDKEGKTVWSEPCPCSPRRCRCPVLFSGSEDDPIFLDLWKQFQIQMNHMEQLDDVMEHAVDGCKFTVQFIERYISITLPINTFLCRFDRISRLYIVNK